MLPVTPYAPKCQLAVWNANVGKLDLTDDLLSLTTSSGIDTPTGKWAAQLTGRKVGGRGFLDRIKPMDYVEIAIARVPSRGGLALTMRGIVDNIQESISSGHWEVSLNGRNYGGLLIQYQIYYLTEIDPAASLIPQARLEVNFGIPGGVLSPRQFIDLIYQQIVAPNLATLRTQRPTMPDLRLAVEVPDRFGVNGFTVQPFTGSVWNLINQYASKPWIEVFVVDTPEAPTLRYRFAPLTDWDGASPGGFSAETPVHTLAASDIERISTGVSGNEVFSYYFTYPSYSLLDRMAFKGEGLDLRRNPLVDEQALATFGYRPFEVATPLIPSLAGDPADLTASATPESLDLAADLNVWAYHTNKDNHRFRNGTIVIKGGGEIQPGEYVDIPGLGWRYYVANVDRAIDIVGGSYRTTLAVTRGRPR